MENGDHNDPRRAIRSLNKFYRSYMTALGQVIELGDQAIPYLIEELADKHSNPIALALGHLMDSPEAAKAIPRLLDWVIVSSPVRTDAVSALIRADEKVVPELLDRVRRCVSEQDDEAVRHLLDLGVRLSENSQRKVVGVILELLEDDNPDIREAAVDAVWRLGLPQGARAATILSRLSTSDSSKSVRSAADEALVRLGARPSTTLSAG